MVTSLDADYWIAVFPVPYRFLMFTTRLYSEIRDLIHDFSGLGVVFLARLLPLLGKEYSDGCCPPEYKIWDLVIRNEGQRRFRCPVLM